MEVTKVEEHEDGSATLTVDLTDQETKSLIEMALRIGLIEGLKLVDEKRIKELNESSTTVGNP